MSHLTIQQAFDLALQHHRAGHLQQAEQIYRQILSQQPEHADALHFLGVIAHQTGNHAVAVELIRKAISLNPTVGSYNNNLGTVLQMLGRLDESITSFQRALALDSNDAGAHFNLGTTLRSQARWNEAIASFERAIALKPGDAKFLNNMGTALIHQGRVDKGIACYQQALDNKPDYAEAHLNMGSALVVLQRLDEAIKCFERAVALKADYADAHCNMGMAFQVQGRLDEAIASYKRAAAFKPDDPITAGNLIFAMAYHPECDNRMMAEELRRWNRQHAEPLKQFILPHPNDRNPERKLRIGYVSPDFREHPVGRFLLPLIERHDREDFELFAYAQILRPDGLTERFRALAGDDHWRATVGLSDAQEAEQIRKDKIDILIDLAMHTEGNRLHVFTRKPAPVQATWLAYPGSTGLETMDYRVSDPYLDPPEAENAFYCEETIRLPETYWCYQASGKEPEVNPLPALENGSVTFGSLNNFSKVSAPAIATWGRILQAVPESRLVIHAPEGTCRQRVLQGMEQCGIEAQRIRFVPKKPASEYFGQYHGIDIALDPFPYCGGTTTCDALWMGVPIVSLAGKTAVGRGGLSILSNIGLPELVGKNEEEYVRIAVNLANDLPRLAELRATLRQRMQSSPLMDAPRFARNMEAAYRTMWRKWCSDSK